jgi:hypothetical protein
MVFTSCGTRTKTGDGEIGRVEENAWWWRGRRGIWKTGIAETERWGWRTWEGGLFGYVGMVSS